MYHASPDVGGLAHRSADMSKKNAKTKVACWQTATAEVIDKIEWLLRMPLVSQIWRRMTTAVIPFQFIHSTVYITLRKKGERKEKGRRKEEFTAHLNAGAYN